MLPWGLVKNIAISRQHLVQCLEQFFHVERFWDKLNVVAKFFFDGIPLHQSADGDEFQVRVLRF